MVISENTCFLPYFEKLQHGVIMSWRDEVHRFKVALEVMGFKHILIGLVSAPVLLTNRHVFKNQAAPKIAIPAISVGQKAKR